MSCRCRGVRFGSGEAAAPLEGERRRGREGGSHYRHRLRLPALPRGPYQPAPGGGADQTTPRPTPRRVTRWGRHPPQRLVPPAWGEPPPFSAWFRPYGAGVALPPSAMARSRYLSSSPSMAASAPSPSGNAIYMAAKGRVRLPGSASGTSLPRPGREEPPEGGGREGTLRPRRPLPLRREDVRAASRCALMVLTEKALSRRDGSKRRQFGTVPLKVSGFGGEGSAPAVVGMLGQLRGAEIPGLPAWELVLNERRADLTIG